eukprot:6954164-Prymnesium_polylepis.1
MCIRDSGARIAVRVRRGCWCCARSRIVHAPYCSCAWPTCVRMLEHQTVNRMCCRESGGVVTS